MTSPIGIWAARDPDSKGIWWSDALSAFCMEATVISPLPFALLERHPEDDTSYWNDYFKHIHTGPQDSRIKAKAFCKDVIISLGQRPFADNNILTFTSLLHPAAKAYNDSKVQGVQGVQEGQSGWRPIHMTSRFLSPSTLAMHIPMEEIHRIPGMSGLHDSSVCVYDGIGNSLEEKRQAHTRYNPFEMCLRSAAISSNIKRPKLDVTGITYGKILVVGYASSSLASCWMSHHQILECVTNQLYDEVISRNHPIDIQDIQS